MSFLKRAGKYTTLLLQVSFQDNHQDEDTLFGPVSFVLTVVCPLVLVSRWWKLYV